MTLKSRLSRLQSQAGARPAPATPAPVASTLRERLAHMRPERLHGERVMRTGRMTDEALAYALEGEIIGEGLIRVARSFPLAGHVGATALAGLRETPLLPGEKSPAPAIYIDTETTGLSGGSGTIAFLVGVAIVSDKAIELTQLLMTRFAAEALLLQQLEQLLPAAHRLVSYNGKSYDLPLLQTRFRMQGLKSGIAALEHLDLLHPVRRLFGRRWVDCRLTTVERRLLGFTRSDDLPGSEAPDAWFSYIRAGDGERLIKVVAHNCQDILSLAAAHLAIAEAIARPRQQGADIYALARWWSKLEEERALALLQGNSNGLCDDGRRLMAHLLRRQGRWAEAVVLWEALAQRGCTESVERLAKYHEHVNRDLEAALYYCSLLPGTSLVRARRERIGNKLKCRSRDLLLLCG